MMTDIIKDNRYMMTDIIKDNRYNKRQYTVLYHIYTQIIILKTIEKKIKQIIYAKVRI